MNYIILQLNDKENFVSGYAYSDVPNGTNVASTQWSQVTAEYVTQKNGSTAAQSPALPTGVTQANLDSGDVFEWPFTVEVNAHASNNDKQTTVESQLVTLEVETINDLQSRLRFWGFEGSI